MNNINEQDIQLLEAVVNATNTGNALPVGDEHTQTLTAFGLIACAEGVIDPESGLKCYHATKAGADYLASLGTVVEQTAPVVENSVSSVEGAEEKNTATKFETGGGFEVPAKVTRGGGSSRTYPFETLELNGYIFVPATEKRPDPKKSLASTVSSANKRFEQFSPRRFFRTFRAAKGQVFGNIVAPSAGAYIVRVEPPVEDKPLDA